MEPFHIYGKTERGIAALNAARGAIPSSARQLLILIDGQRNVGELQGIFGEDALGKLLPQLEAQGYVKHLRDSPAARPATISGGRPATLLGTRSPTVAGARPPTISVAARQSDASGAAAAATPAAASNVLAKSLLAMGVLAVSGALWWFLGQAHIPGISAAPEIAASAPVAAGPAAEAPTPPPAVPAAPVATVGFDRTTPRNRDTVRPDARNAAAATTPAKAAAPTTGPGTAAAVAGSTVETPRTGAPVAAPPPGGGASLAAGTPLAAAPDGSTPAAQAPNTAKAVPTPAPGVAAASTPAPAQPPPAQTGPASGTSAPANATTVAAAALPATKPAASPGAPVLHPRERTMPVLSKNARRAGVDSGELVVRLHVTARGTVESIDVVKANPRQVYDLTIEQTLKKWTFDPPGAPVESTVEFSFKP